MNTGSPHTKPYKWQRALPAMLWHCGCHMVIQTVLVLWREKWEKGALFRSFPLSILSGQCQTGSWVDFLGWVRRYQPPLPEKSPGIRTTQLIVSTIYWRLWRSRVSLPRIPGWVLTWVPGRSPHSHQDKEGNKNSLWFCRLKIAPDILVPCREIMYTLYASNQGLDSVPNGLKSYKSRQYQYWKRSNDTYSEDTKVLTYLLKF